MSLLKKIIIGILAVLLLLIIVGFVVFNQLSPNYSGEVQLSNLKEKSTTYYDEYGIPHIYSENKEDAFRTLGFVHAQDRLWQMELLRRIAPGKLSEIFGGVMVKNDVFFKTLGIDAYTQKTVQNINKNEEAYKLTMAYINGINQFMEQGPTPIEFILLGIEKEPFKINDVYNILGYMSFSFAMAHKTDPLLTLLQEKLGDEYLQYLNISVNPTSTLKKNFKGNLNELEEVITRVNNVLNSTPSPQFIGSNAWVLAGEKTASGKVLFANDPHIGYSQPPVWYEAHVNTPTYEMYGYHIAGVPFPLLGHNHNFAFGLTMFENDDLDFYQEENHPTDSLKYKTAKGYKLYQTSTETINVKDSASVQVEIKSTHHGPLVNNALESIKQQSPIAISWTYLKHNNQLLQALHTMVTAKNILQVKRGVSLIHAPGLNVMYGDAKGNIAWWASGKLYKFNSHVNPKFVLNGSSGTDEPIAYLDFNNNPMAENPPWNYVYSANNQPDSINGYLYPGYYLPEDRAKRIKSLLTAKNNWEKDDFKVMLNDVTSPISPKIIEKVFNVITLDDFSENEKEKLEILNKWDGANTKNSIAATIYNKWIYVYLKNTFKDEMGDTIFNHLLNTHLMKRTIAEHIDFEQSPWWDNVSTTIKENRKTIFTTSLKETISALENQLGKNTSAWTWSKVHTLEHKHPLGEVAALRNYFNVGKFAMQGAREVIDNRGYLYDSTGVYNIYSGPSTRRIIDFSDVENSVSILPTGQSGNPFSKHYKDQAALYNTGKFRKMKLNKEEIINTSTTLTFIPKNE